MRPIKSAPAPDDELLSAVVWPFVVPVGEANLGRKTEKELLKQAVQFAMQEESVRY